MARVPHAFLWAALAACSLKASASAHREDAPDRPSAADFRMAMDHALVDQLSGMTNVMYGDCAAVTKLQCSPAENGRSKCTYVRHGGKHGTAILEKKADKSWHWVSGPLNCSVGLSN